MKKLFVGLLAMTFVLSVLLATPVFADNPNVEKAEVQKESQHLSEIRHLYAISVYTGKVILYSTVAARENLPDVLVTRTHNGVEVYTWLDAEKKGHEHHKADGEIIHISDVRLELSDDGTIHIE